jgi:hypothetical protein
MPIVQKCPSCSNPIVYVLSDRGRAVAVNPEPVNVLLEDDRDSTWKLQAGFIPHRRTCAKTERPVEPEATGSPDVTSADLGRQMKPRRRRAAQEPGNGPGSQPTP